MISGQINKKFLTAFLVILTVLLLRPSHVTVAQDKTIVWLAVDESLATEIENTLGTDYEFLIGDEYDLVNEINRRKISGKSTDIIIGWSDNIPNLAIKNLLTPLDEGSLDDRAGSVERTVVFYEVEPSGNSATILDGTVALYGYPIAAQSIVLLVNEDLVDSSAEFDTIEKFENAAIQSNDQSNPTAKIYGMSFDNVLDATLWQYYAYGGQLFEDGIIDTRHLIVNNESSLEALGKVNNLLNVQKITSRDADESPLTLFTEDKTLSILVADFERYNQIVTNTTLSLGEDKIGIYATPGGSPLHSISVMIGSGASDELKTTAQTIQETLIETEFQTEVFEQGYIPISDREIGRVDTNSEVERALENNLDNSLRLPIDPLWDDILEVLDNQFLKFYNGDQNHTRTALATEVNLKLILPNEAKWQPLEIDDGSGRNGFLFYSPPWLLASGILSLIYIRKRRLR